jgi:hypothetical protein
MKNFWQYTSILLAIVVFILCGLLSCEHSKRKDLQKECGQKLSKVDTVTVHDTIKEAFTMPVYVPQPYRIEVNKPVPVYVEGKEVIREVDTANILKDYFSTRFYSDTQNVTNAQIIINDQVSENRIKQRQVLGTIEKEIVTNNITNTIEAKKRNALYGGVIGQGGGVPMALGGSVMFIHKKGIGLEAGALLDTKGKLIYQGSFKIKLK